MTFPLSHITITAAAVLLFSWIGNYYMIIYVSFDYISPGGGQYSSISLQGTPVLPLKSLNDHFFI